MKVIQTFKPVKKIYIPPELPNKHNSNENQENEEKGSKHDENEENINNNKEVEEEVTDVKSKEVDEEEEEKPDENKLDDDDKSKDDKPKDDNDTVKFELPVDLELKEEIQDTNLMHCLNYIEENINNLLMINYTINLSNILNNNQQSQRNNMVDSNTISSKIEGENAISNENSIIPNNQETNSLLGIGPLPPVTYNGINVPILR